MSIDGTTVSFCTVNDKQGLPACGPSARRRVGRAGQGLPAPRPGAYLPRCEGTGDGMQAAHTKCNLSPGARHVLQTPLTSIKAFAEILLANPDLDAEERQRYLRIVVEESDRLSRCIDHILRPDSNLGLD